nr:probable sucrose-phosphate synthase 1 [Tanacetum cinerariifolium]
MGITTTSLTPQGAAVVFSTGSAATTAVAPPRRWWPIRHPQPTTTATAARKAAVVAVVPAVVVDLCEAVARGCGVGCVMDEKRGESGGCSGVVGGGGSGVKWRLPWWCRLPAAVHAMVDLIDRATGRHFGVRRKSSPKNFSGGGSRPEMVAGGGGGRLAAGEEGESNLVFPSSATYPKHHKQKDAPDIYRLVAKTKGVFINSAFIEPFGLTLIELPLLWTTFQTTGP